MIKKERKKTAKQIEKERIKKLCDSLDHVAYRTPMGTVFYPYMKGDSKYLEASDGEYDPLRHIYIPYTGFILPYNGAPSYLSRYRAYYEIRKFAPDYEIIDIPMIQPVMMDHKYHLRNIDTFRTAQSEIINRIEGNRFKERSWFVNLQTGEGKTLLSIYLASRFGYKTWLFCFSNDVLDQWIDGLDRYTSMDTSKILRCHSYEFDRILDGRINIHDYDIYVSTLTGLDMYAKKKQNYHIINDLFSKIGIGLMIVDEAHRNIGNIVRFNSVLNVKYQLYLSADFGQGDYKHDQLFRKVFDQVPVLRPEEETRKSLKYTKVIRYDFNTHPTRLQEDSVFDKYGYDCQMYMIYEFQKGTIINVIRSIVSQAQYMKSECKRILILFTNIAHCDITTYVLRKYFPYLSIGAYHSGISSEEKLETKNYADVIVGTYSSFGVGLDTEDIKIVITTDNCNRVFDNQAAGRARRLRDGTEAMYFLLIDEGFSYAKKKAVVRLNYLKETKAKDDEIQHYTYNEKEFPYEDPRELIEEARRATGHGSDESEYESERVDDPEVEFDDL